MGRWTLLGTPVYTLAGYRGMGEAPPALRRAGVTRALGAEADLGDVTIPPLVSDIDEGKVKNLGHFKKANALIYGAARSTRAERVAVLGGECSETVGAMAGLAEVFHGRAGMLWMDAHGDFNTPETSPSGYIGGMPLALATGRGREIGLLPGVPPLADERLVHVGSRALDPPEEKAFRASQAWLITSTDVKKKGAGAVARETADHLADVSDWIAVHLDVDVADPSLIPAVNYPTPGGLDLAEVAAIIRAVEETGKLRVFELAAYNAAKDADGYSVKNVVETVRRALP